MYAWLDSRRRVPEYLKSGILPGRPFHEQIDRECATSRNESAHAQKTIGKVTAARIFVTMFRSGDDVLHDLAVDVGQSKITAGVAVRQPGVGELHPVQDSVWTFSSAATTSLSSLLHSST